jgi:signal transduction histidine kinase
VMLLGHRLKANEHRPAIQIVKQYQDVPPIECYPGQLNQVFMNLMANAIDALEEANRVADRPYADRLQQPNQITISTAVNDLNNALVLRFKDNGTGIPEAVQARIFEPSFTTKAVGKGTGLGLPISRQIVADHHHGRLECCSTVGEGTEFVITLPLERSSSS